MDASEIELGKIIYNVPEAPRVNDEITDSCHEEDVCYYYRTWRRSTIVVSGVQTAEGQRIRT